MTDQSQNLSPQADYAAQANPAVARCCQALDRVRAESEEGGKGMIFSTMDAAQAYRRAMPPLAGLENIRDFIACTAHGMLIGAIKAQDAARLLYAAQCARGALPPAKK
jgi:hypothetical protein